MVTMQHPIAVVAEADATAATEKKIIIKKYQYSHHIKKSVRRETAR